MAKFVFLILIFASFTCWLCILHYFAPNISDESIKGELKFPNSLQELQEIAVILKAYSVNHWWYVLLLFGSAYIYKQAFCIPGSIFLNLLSGALYGHIGGIFFACLFTAIGASICYYISRTFARDLVYHYFPKRIASFQEKLSINKDNLFYFMLFIRLVPITPGWVINVAAPLVEVPIFIFFITTLFGLGPYNFVGVSAGGMLASLQSINDIFTWGVLLKISAVGILTSLPAYIFRKVSTSH